MVFNFNLLLKLLCNLAIIYRGGYKNLCLDLGGLHCSFVKLRMGHKNIYTLSKRSSAPPPSVIMTGHLLGKTNFASDVSKLTAYFSQLLLAPLSFQRNFLASHHVKSCTKNCLSFRYFHVKMLQMFLDKIRTITVNKSVYI